MDAIRYIQRRGVGLYLDGDQLKAFPSQRLDLNLRSFIRDHRDAIIAALQTPDLDTTVGNLLALSPEEREQYRQELESAPRNRPWIEHDREAYQRAQEILKRRENGVAA